MTQRGTTQRDSTDSPAAVLTTVTPRSSRVSFVTSVLRLALEMPSKLELLDTTVRNVRNKLRCFYRTEQQQPGALIR